MPLPPPCPRRPHRHQHADVLEWVLFLNAHDEFVYRVAFGDKDTFRAGFDLAGKRERFYQVGGGWGFGVPGPGAGPLGCRGRKGSWTFVLGARWAAVPMVGGARLAGGKARVPGRSMFLGVRWAGLGCLGASCCLGGRRGRWLVVEAGCPGACCRPARWTGKYL